MEPISVPSPIIKKQEDDDKLDKRDIKPVPKTLNRVPRTSLAASGTSYSHDPSLDIVKVPA